MTLNVKPTSRFKKELVLSFERTGTHSDLF